MKTKLKILAATMLACVCGSGFAEGEKAQPAPMQHGQAGGMGNMGVPGGANMGGPGRSPGGSMTSMMSPEMKEQQLKMKQEYGLKMHDLSTRILAAKDEQEREKLKAEQLQLMKDQDKAHMEMMQQHMRQMMQHGGPGQAPAAAQPMQHGAPGQAPAAQPMQHGAPGQAPMAQPPKAAPAQPMQHDGAGASGH